MKIGCPSGILYLVEKVNTVFSQGCNVVDQPELILKYHQLVDEKSDLETTSKQTLKRMMNEKMDIQNKYEDLKRSLNKSEEESEIYREQLTRVEKMSQKLLEGKIYWV